MSSSGTRVGDVLASKYRLEELLGSGGMGHVYRAVNEDVGRAVAIKVLRSEHATNKPIVERFMREARAANLVRHPNVVDVLDIGRDGDGSPFIVQELLKGQDLSKYIEKRGGKLSLAEIEEYLLPVVDAVAEAHARGVVHRDIKPENVFLAEQGTRRIPKLLDFGISKIRMPDIRATEVGVMMGTPAYMAPEQIQGSRDADPRSDVWALGIMLFELLSGRLPFVEATDAPMLFVAIATKDVPKLIDVCPEISSDVSRVAERCLRRMPDDRYPTALELARDFRHVLEGEDLEPTQTRSLPPDAAAIIAGLNVPDLVLPPPKAAQTAKGFAPPSPPKPDAPKTVRGPPGLALNKTELSTAPPPPRSSNPIRTASSPSGMPRDPRGSAPALNAAPAPMPARHPSAPDLALPSSQPTSSSGKPAAPASSGSTTSGSPPSRQYVPPESAGGMDGVMMTGASTSTQRRPVSNAFLPDYRAQPQQPEGPDMSLLIGLASVGLAAIGATAVLMTFAHQPDGWPIVAFVMKPTPTLSLLVQGGLGAVAMVLAGRMAIAGVKKWRGELDGGRPAAIFNALLAGGFFFAAIELARAAW